MARLTAVRLRDRAREAMLSAGARGFVRFLPPGGALLATDALRRCADEAARARLTAALAAAGFVCAERDGLLTLTPGDGLLTAPEGKSIGVDWESPLHPAQALANRLLATKKQPLTDEGRHLVLETLRLTWALRDETLLAGLPALRAQAAAMLRGNDRSGLHEAGALLAEYSERGGERDEA